MKEADPAFDSLKEVLKEKAKSEKEYQERLEMMMDFKIENVLRKHFEEPANYNDIMSKNLNSASPELKMKIVEAWVVFKWIKNFMQSYNIEFNPAILSGQEYDFKRHGKMLEKLSEVVSNITPPYSDETVTLKSKKIEQLSISLQELEDKINDWCNPQDRLYQEYLKVKKLIEEDSVTSVDLEDDNDISKFLIDNDILEISKGIIYLEE